METVMIQRKLRTFILGAVLAAAGCAQTPEPAPTMDHPANPRAAEAPAPPADETPAVPTAYTCPHHPGVMQAEPGECPICNMKLEPTTSRQTSPLRAAPAQPAEPGHEGHAR